MNKTFIKRPICFLLSLMMIAGLYPFSIIAANGAVPTPFSAMGEAKAADPSTMNDWVKYFNDSTTEYAGAVWTDKSVFTDASAFAANGISLKKQDDFLVALSAMASNMTVEGMEYSPTDTVLILDVSISMQNSSSGNGLADEMVEAANQSIASLLAAGKHNRVSVVAFSEEATLLLPLGRYTTAADGKYLAYSQAGSSGGGYWGSSGTETISVDPDTFIEGSNTQKPATASVTVDGSTYTQTGLKKAIDIFLDQSGNTTVNDPALGTLSRIPIVVLMSDGEPTYATTNFTSPHPDERFGTGMPGQNNGESLAFVTQLTLAYAQNQINAVYGDSLIYTLGLGVGSNSAAKSVLDPANSSTAINDFWEQYNEAANSDKIEVYRSSSGGGYPGFGGGYPGSGGSNSSSSTQYVTKIATPLNKNYVEKYIEVSTSTANPGADLVAAFDDIVKQIQLKSKFYPTLVEGSEYLSGYVSFVDKLGKYMEVKDVKGLLINNVLHTGHSFAKHLIEHHSGGNISLDPNDICYEFIDSVEKRLGIDESTALTLVALAIANGQLAYNSTANTFSNYIGWFSDANGNFVGFWHEGIANIPANATHINRSYGFFGDTDATHNIDEHDMLYATVRVREEIATGFESVAFAVPASLIPTRTYNVSLDESGNPTNITLTGDNNPIRLVYEAGLEDAINEVTVQTLVTDAEYLHEHVKNGEYEFYTNRFDHGTSVTAYGTNNTYSYFTPSKENERYYYLSNSLVYTDKNGTLYTGDSTPAENGTYYRAITVYQKSGSNCFKNTVYEQIMPHALSRSGGTPLYLAKNSDNTWYVKAGTAHNYVEGREVLKNPNVTGSVNYSYHPFVDAQNEYIVGAVLGNNGRLVLTPATGIKVTKTVEEVNTDPTAPTSFTFVVTNKTNAADSSTYKTYHVAANGTVTEGIIAFANGTASFSIKDGEKFYITGMTAGNVFTVAEEESVSYFCKQNNIDLTVVSKSLVSADFVNTARGKGNLTVAKEVAHSFGTSYLIPEGKTFNFEVALDGAGIIGKTFEAKHSGDATVTAVTVGADGKVTFSLKHNEEFEIYGLPEGTKAFVVELNPGAGFTSVYYENNLPDDGKITVQKNAIDVIKVVNEYNPAKVDPVNITVSGTKTLEGRDWSADDEFIFVLQKLNEDGETWTELGTASVKGTDASKSFTFTNVFANTVYDKAGTYYYRITEKEGSVLGMNYDRTVHAFAVIVGDADMDGKLEIAEVRPERETVTVAFGEGSWNVTANFKNVYNLKETTASIDITKLITNESESPLALLAGFRFELYEGNTLIATSEPTTDRGFTRLNLTFNTAGEHTYTLKEIIPSEAPAGWTYDTKEVTLKLSVTADASAGTLVAKFADTGTNTASATFTNVYSPAPASITLDVRKSLTGRKLAPGEFSFEIRETSGAKVASGTNDGDGKVTFDKALSFNKVGVYHYDVIETSVDGKGVTTDKSPRRVTVTVVDNGGSLSASYVVESTAENYIVFTNTYTAQPAKYTVTGKKLLEGRALLNAEFKFTLTVSDGEGNVATGAQSYTVENRLDGSFNFPELVFNSAGDYFYVVTEVNDSAIPGVKYDATKYIIKITVKDNLEGQLVVEAPVIHIAGSGIATEVTFTNVYTPAPASADIAGDKVYETMIDGKVTSKEFGANAFSFSIYESNAEWAENGKLIETVSNDASGNFSFKTLNFTAAGDYYYVVKELHGGQTINGVVYDDAVFRIRIEVKDDGNGKLYTIVHKTDKNNIPTESIVFKNNYVITASAEITLTGIKILKNRDMAADMFEFALYKADENQNITDTAPVEVVKNNAAGEFTFSELVFDGKDGHRGAGTYYYIIKEVAGSLGGITYDTQQYFIKITVTDTDSVLSASATGADNVVFTNVYNTESAKVTLIGKKELTGKTLAKDDFSFVLSQVGGNYTETVKNAADGSFIFAELTFDKAGTYTYTISEVIGFAGGVKYDDTKYTVTVTVTDNGEGKLVAEVEGANSILFKNSYSTDSAEVRINGTKQLLGRPLVSGEFEFILEGEGVSQTVKVNADGSFAFDAMTYTNVGTYKYTVKEVKGSIAGITYDETVYNVTVEVTDNGEGKLVAKVTGADSITFTNKYKASEAEIIFSGKKQLSGRPLKAGEFSFTLVGANDGINETVQNDADGNFVFHTVKYDTAGTYTYTISEVKGSLGGVTYDTNVYTVTVVVTDDTEAGKLVAKIQDSTPVVFKNTYSTEKATAQISGKKVLSGRDLTAGEFSFVISGAGINETVTNDANGNFTFSAIEYSTAGTYTYTVSEVKGSLAGIKYDETVYTVTVTVTDNGEGKLSAEVSTSAPIVFNNAYMVQSEVAVISGTKNLIGRELIPGEFSFELYNAKLENNAFITDGPAISIVTNKENGSFAFDAITYTHAGEYIYIVRETAGSLLNVEYDKTEYVVKVTVTDVEAALRSKVEIFVNDESRKGIVFTNKYTVESISYTFNGKKVLFGRELGQGEFTFEITDLASGNVVSTATNDADGNIEFTLNFPAAGTYNYSLKELNTAAGGIIYDGITYFITATVTMGEDGKLSATVSGADNIRFNNTYVPTNATVQIFGSKTLLGRELVAREFLFELRDETGSVVSTATNSTSGVFAFEAFTYSKPGIYNYTVTEVNNGLPGITYDQSSFKVTVVVTDNGSGALKAEVYAQSDIIFINSYQATPAEITFSGIKNLHGRVLREGEFSFELSSGSGNVVEVVTNGAGGSINFSTLTFMTEGRYTYTIREIDENLNAVYYDRQVYNITVVVTDDGMGRMIATVEGADNIVFNNYYNPASTFATFRGTKILEGGELTEAAFSFELRDINGKVLETAQNNADGSFSFSTIEYDSTGIYYYTVSEVIGNDEGILYDATVYTVKVMVIDNGKGKLVATVESDSIVFTNCVVTPPEETTEAPEETTEVPEETTTAPEETTLTPEETTQVPEETTITPEETTETPEETTEIPGDSTETPNPSTGDSSSVVIWFGAVIIAFCATAGALFSKKRETDNE